MAYCPGCKSDRPITRQTFTGRCRYCGKGDPHSSPCRGPVAKWMDVCTYCNEPIFAKATTQDEYKRACDAESVQAELDAGRARLGTYVFMGVVGVFVLTLLFPIPIISLIVITVGGIASYGIRDGWF